MDFFVKPGARDLENAIRKLRLFFSQEVKPELGRREYALSKIGKRKQKDLRNLKRKLRAAKRSQQTRSQRLKQKHPPLRDVVKSGAIQTPPVDEWRADLSRKWSVR